MSALLHFLLLTAVSFVSINAQHVHFEPPWVQSVVASATSRYGDWLWYHGPTGAGPAWTQPTAHPYPYPYPPNESGCKPQPNVTNTCSYWLEEIKHQGVAPFQNDTTYQVFRNVKDYGAKGE